MFKKLFGKNKGKGKSLEEEVQQDQVKNTPKVENQPYQNKKNKPIELSKFSWSMKVDTL